MKNETVSFSAHNLWIGGQWVTDQTITVQNGKISRVEDGAGENAVYYLVPGLLDNHIHGGYGFDAGTCEETGLEQWLLRMAQNGVCGVVLCPYGPPESIRRTLMCCRAVMDRQKRGECAGAILLGVHPEGPFLSPERPGAMEETSILKPDVATYQRIFDGCEDLLQEITMAPEEDPDFHLIRYLRDRGVRVLAGHTDCDYETAVGSFAAGVGATCHTFNAMRPLKHRDPGILAAALTTSEIFCEMISDTVHLHPGTIRLLYHCKKADRLMIVSDAVETTGMPDGVYHLPHETVYVRNGENRLADGTLDGGACMISGSVGKLFQLGLPAKDILRMASVTPADWLGLTDWAIAPGNPARLSGFDKDLHPIFTCIGARTWKHGTASN